MDRPSRDHVDSGASPATWAVPAAITYLAAGYFLIDRLPRNVDIYWRPVKHTIGLFRRVDVPALFPALALLLAVAITIVGLRMRTVLRALGSRNSMPDLAAAGGMLAGSTTAVAAMLAWTAYFAEFADYLRDTPGLQAILFLLVLALWLYPLTVGLGLITAGAASCLRERGSIGPVAAGLGKAAATVALTSPISLVIGHFVLLTLVGQIATLLWLVVVPRDV